MHTLRDGTPLPHLGLGTGSLRGPDGVRAMVSALEAGYRYLDTATLYQNEAEVGAAVRASGVPREEVLVATKIPGRAHQRSAAIEAVQASLSRLRSDRVDLVLVHWPNPRQGRYVEAFEALLECRERGLLRWVGTSNFTAAHLDDVHRATGELPVLNQVELHPAFGQPRMVQVHRELGVLTQAWSPLGKEQARYDAAPVAGPARRLGVTPAQVILRWHLQRGVMPVPLSADPGRQRSNLDVTSFTLTEPEMAAITAMDRPDGRRNDLDPDTTEMM